VGEINGLSLVFIDFYVTALTPRFHRSEAALELSENIALSKPGDQTNQPKPTKKLTKGGVLRKRQASSLARFNHSCVLDALLEMVRGALKL
jgi:hypothetical protein